MPEYEIHRHYDDNEYTREGRNGRMYSGRVGWRYLVFRTADHTVVADYGRKRDARAYITRQLGKPGADHAKRDARPPAHD